LFTYESNDNETYPYKILTGDLASEEMAQPEFKLKNINSLALNGAED
jgi:hypothetical protein